MTADLLSGILGAAAGAGLGLGQFFLLKRLLPGGARPALAWLLPVKLLLWAAGLILGMLAGPACGLALAAAAIAVYLAQAIRFFFRAR